MTAWKLNQFCAQPVARNPFGPFPAKHAVLAAYHGSTRTRGKLGQRERQGGRIHRLLTQLLEGRLDDSVVTVAADPFPEQCEIHEPHAELRIGFSAPRVITQVRHVRLVGQLTVEALANLRDHGTQVHQVPHRSTSRNQRNRQTAKRVPHNHHIVAAPIEGSAHHIRIVFEARRAVLNRQVHHDYLMSRLTQKRSQTLPTPRTMKGAMHENERRHAASVMMMSDLAGRNPTPRRSPGNHADSGSTTSDRFTGYRQPQCSCAAKDFGKSSACGWWCRVGAGWTGGHQHGYHGRGGHNDASRSRQKTVKKCGYSVRNLSGSATDPLRAALWIT
jgi:hypothetical protein